MANGFPTYKKTANTGEKGVNAVSSLVNDNFGWIFRRNSNEYDFGIDGYIDIVLEDGTVTGQCFAVQIKTGQSFFRQKNKYSFTFYGKEKHLNYYLNLAMPVLIIVHDDINEATYWQRFDQASTEATPTGWKAEIPFENILSQGKSKLLALLGPPKDHTKEIQAHWAFNNQLAKYDFIHYAVDRYDVETLNTSHILDFFKRIEASDALCRKFQGRIEISISGYDKDPRELWEIKETVDWFKKADPDINWFFFSYLKSPARGFRCYLSCLCNAKRAKKQKKAAPGHILVELDLKQYPYILNSNFEKLNLMTDRLGMPEEENKRISFEATDIMGLPRPKQR
ncbi:DUF4365 domain-containing protein [Stutzerimonas stutzeri]|uniref:DUF4365 domain-containing protein n=1 Tax=Stutzerimonas stutzeri TaxID=316 RepID=UPI0009BB6122|nr:DUF4365 and DUF1817 domain-containing protein [Stutzerimonas stutzeri]